MCKSRMTHPVVGIQSTQALMAADATAAVVVNEKDDSCSINNVLNKNHRKRTVRFCDDDKTDVDTHCTRPVKRRIVELTSVPPSSLMTLEEKSSCWRQREDHQETSRDVQHIVRHCQGSSSSSADSTSTSYVDFAESFATIYNICNNDSDEKEEQLPLDQMIVLGSSYTCTRGLESRIMPGLGHHRLLKRRELIRSVLGLQQELRVLQNSTTTTTSQSESDIAEGLGAVSQYLSKPSRRFARALGVVDGTLALLEYATSTSAAGAQTKQQDSCSGVTSLRMGAVKPSCLNTSTPVIA